MNKYKWLSVKSVYLTSVVPLVTKLLSMEAEGAPFTPRPLSVLLKWMEWMNKDDKNIPGVKAVW